MAYPTTPAFKYPVVRRLAFETGIAKGQDGTEQRWMKTCGLESWDLTYSHLTLAQRDLLLDHFETCKGAHDSFNFVFGGTTFPGCHYADDKLLFVEQPAKVWSGSVKLAQRFRAPDTGSLGTFPVLASGARMQYPFTHGKSFDTVAVQTEGYRYEWYNRSASLRTWSAGGPALSDADALAVWDYFRKAHGMHAAFTFKDPDSLADFSPCRFGTDVLEWRYSNMRMNDLQVMVEQVL